MVAKCVTAWVATDVSAKANSDMNLGIPARLKAKSILTRLSKVLSRVYQQGKFFDAGGIFRNSRRLVRALREGRRLVMRSAS